MVMKGNLEHMIPCYTFHELVSYCFDYPVADSSTNTCSSTNTTKICEICDLYHAVPYRGTQHGIYNKVYILE